MPKYLFQANYTAEGAKGILKDGGTGRRAAVEKAVSGLGGRLESFYFGIRRHRCVRDRRNAGQHDGGGHRACRRAIRQGFGEHDGAADAEEVDAATKKSVAYRGAGG